MSDSGSRFVLRAKDRVVFLGDSITEQQLYSNYVESYLASRYPELGLTFLNAGWGGDTAPGGVLRLERDVLALKPTVVTVCYGMNDGAYTAPTAEIRERYLTGMRTLVAQLKAAGVRIVLLTPGMADESVNQNLARAAYNRQGLRVLADAVLELAAAEALPVYDLHQLMNEVNDRARAAHPGFTMVPDGVHPDPAGQLVMAYGLLQALGVPPRCQEVTVSLENGWVNASEGLLAKPPRKHEFGALLELRLDRLPFFVEPLARKVLPFLPFQETYNQLRFRVLGVPSTCGSIKSELTNRSFTRAELAAGINLFELWSLPPLSRAAAVHRYTQETNQVYYKLWRQLALAGQKGPEYNAGVHAAAIRLATPLDRARRKLMDRNGLTCNLNLIATDRAGEALGSGDFVSHWACLGPFPKPFDNDRLGGEAACTASLPATNGDWQACELNLNTPSRNLIEIFGARSDCFVYALTCLESPLAQRAEIRLGSDDGVRVWLNGQVVWDNLQAARGVVVDQDRFPIQLRAGQNVLLVKVTQGGGDWGFCLRLAGLAKPVMALWPHEAAATR